MPTYYYVTVDARGRPHSARMEAADPETVVRDVGGRGEHVAMVYRCEAPPPIPPLPLMDNWNWPVPTHLHKRRPRCRPDGLCWFIDKDALDLAIRRGLVDGRVGWYSTSVQTQSLLDAVSRVAAELLFAPALSLLRASPPDFDGIEQRRLQELAKFLRFRRVDADAAQPLPMVSIPGLALKDAAMWRCVPWPGREGAVTLLAAWPALIETQQVEIEQILGRRVEFVRCSDDPQRNQEVVDALVSRQLPETESGLHAVVADRVAEERQLPEESRVAVFLDSLGILVAPKDPPPIFRRAGLMVHEAGTMGFRGLRLTPSPPPSSVEACYGERRIIIGDPPRALLQPTMVLLGAAVGIDPTVGPPAMGERRMELAGARYLLRGRSELTDAGETLEIEWGPA
ncbi:MAG: hypothetical protein HZA54_07135 [Planctomycetes bacterium]|nr:hypothetical protein [Planctomycetota bacterium]